MKKIILLFVFLITTLSSFSQLGGASKQKYKLVNSGNTIRALQINSDGTIIPLDNGSENQIYKITDGVPKWSTYYNPNRVPQTLTGLTPTYDASVSLNANYTITGNATITFTNLPIGDRGDLYVIHDSSGTIYTITLAGYTFEISQAIWSSTNTILTKASGGHNIYSWYYNGSVVIITGQIDLKY